MSLSCRASVSARGVMLVMATAVMPSTRASWTMVAAMTWWVVEELSSGWHGRGGSPAHWQVLQQPWHWVNCKSLCYVISLACMMCSKDGSSDFCGFTQPKQSPRLAVWGEHSVPPQRQQLKVFVCATGTQKARIQFGDRCKRITCACSLISSSFPGICRLHVYPLVEESDPVFALKATVGMAWCATGTFSKLVKSKCLRPFWEWENWLCSLFTFPCYLSWPFCQHQCEVQVYSKTTGTEVMPRLITASETIISKLLHPCAGSTCPVQ